MKKFILFFIILILFAVCVQGLDICKDNTPPSAPGSLSISDSPYDSDGNVVLSWSAATDTPECSGVAYYNIYRSTDNENFTKIGQALNLTFSDNGLTQGTTYYYRVTAVDKVLVMPNEGPYVSAQTTIGTAPSDDGGSSGGGGGGGGGGGSSGGGGGGGGGAYTCNMGWNCTEWSECEDGWKTRECSFVKVPQHTSTEPCPEISDVPDRARKCTKVVVIEAEEEQATALRTKEEPTEEVIEEITEETAPTGLAVLTGAAIANLGKNLGVIGLLVLLIVVGVIYYYRKKHKQE